MAKTVHSMVGHQLAAVIRGKGKDISRLLELKRPCIVSIERYRFSELDEDNIKSVSPS
jgi:hypothetical protein